MQPSAIVSSVPMKKSLFSIMVFEYTYISNFNIEVHTKQNV